MKKCIILVLSSLVFLFAYGCSASDINTSTSTTITIQVPTSTPKPTPTKTPEQIEQEKAEEKEKKIREKNDDLVMVAKKCLIVYYGLAGNISENHFHGAELRDIDSSGHYLIYVNMKIATWSTADCENYFVIVYDLKNVGTSNYDDGTYKYDVFKIDSYASEKEAETAIKEKYNWNE